MKTSSDINQFTNRLLAWYDLNGRHDLPWQHPKTAYRVWVSEIMLQQTQVKTVIPYYEKFMQCFPSIAALAEASQEEVMAYWSGLGYYARARNLHRAAQMIQSRHEGSFPSDFESVLALPGIGPSTAGAILSIAFQKRFPILDGNVKRVLSRVYAVDAWPGEARIEKYLWEKAEMLTPLTRFDDYTQAIMDMGATLCTRTRPNCDQCPVSTFCQAWLQDRVAEFPKSKPKKTKPTKDAWFLMLLNKRGQLWLEKRAEKGIWGSLWSFPQYESPDVLQADWDTMANIDRSREKSSEDKVRPLDLIEWPELIHSFSHYHLRMHPMHFSAYPESFSSRLSKTKTKGKWFDLSDVRALGLPAPIRKLVTELEKLHG